MSKRKRLARPVHELKQELIDQLHLLRLACQNFDSGVEAAGKDIALRIRILVHEYRQSRALLEQLGLRTHRFLDSAGPIDPRNLLPTHNLLSLRVGTLGSQYVPALAAGGALPREMRAIPFTNWWNQPVIKDTDGRVFNRRELILHVADTDGGAHVDPSIDEDYAALTRGNSLGWVFRLNGVDAGIVQGKPELACMRQIAHELFCTIQRNSIEFEPYATPPYPSR